MNFEFISTAAAMCITFCRTRWRAGSCSFDCGLQSQWYICCSKASGCSSILHLLQDDGYSTTSLMVTVLNRILYLCWWHPDIYNNLKDRLLYNWQCFLNICCWLLKFIPNKQITLLCFLGSGMTVFLLKTNQRGHWWSSLAALWIPLSNQEVTRFISYSPWNGWA